MNALFSKLMVLSVAMVGLSACGAGMGDGQCEPASGFANLIAADPLRHSYDFRRGDYGGVVQDDEVKNAGSHIEYSSYFEGELSVGIQGGEFGAIADLGTDEAVAAQLGVEETVGSGQGFAHLALEGRRFNLLAANEVLSSAPTEMGHAVPQVGHVYVVRIVDSRSAKSEELMVKLLVVAAAEEREIAFEWARLPAAAHVD